MTPLRSTGDHQQRFFTRPRLCQSLPLRRILAATCLGCARDCHVYTVLYYIIVYYIIILYYIISYHIILYYIILYHIILYYIYTIIFILYYIISYHIILYYIILYLYYNVYIILYYIISYYIYSFHNFHFGSKPSTHIQKHLNLRKRRFVCRITAYMFLPCYYMLLMFQEPPNASTSCCEHPCLEI